MSETDEVKSNLTTSSGSTSPGGSGGGGSSGQSPTGGGAKLHQKTPSPTYNYSSPIFWPTGILPLPAAFPPPPVVYRRMTPEEDLMATQQGIDILVKQRSQLVDRLVKHHNKLLRSNEIESLHDFSKQIDAIMRIRGIAIMPSPNPRLPPPLPKKTKIRRGITFECTQ